jgi:hypothetical protein
MARGKKKKKRKHRGDADDGPSGLGAFAGGFAGNVAGQALGQLLGDGLQRKAPSLFGGPDTGPDLPSRMLITLAEQGPKTVAELVDALDAPLQTLLDAIAATRRAKLIERVDKSAVIRVTDPGCQVATVVRRKLEEEGRASAEESTAKGEGN